MCIIRKRFRASSVAFSLFLLSVCPAAADDAGERIRGLIQSKVTVLHERIGSVCEKNIPCPPPPLTLYYEGRDYRPAWISDTAKHFQIESLLNVIRDAPLEGLKPQDYNLEQLEKAIQDERLQNTDSDASADFLADLDILLTETFFRYALHLHAGRVNYSSLRSEWGIQRKEIDLAGILENALENGDVGDALIGLAPRHPLYVALKGALQRHRAIAAAGGWPTIPSGTDIKKGQEGETVMMLQKRLIAVGDLDLPDGAVSSVFDADTENAVRRFQRRHGIKDKGRIGPETLKRLNLPVEDVIRRIELNMDRMRWLPDDLEERYIIVNLADYSLQLIDREEEALGMRIVTGSDKKRSYILSDRISYIELNPYWNIPASIAEEEMLPKIKKDQRYLDKKNIKIMKGWSNPPVFVAPGEIDWPALNVKKFRYRLRQEPGPGNSLGRIKFMFPNKFDVYLHDTSEKHLFRREKRNFSHGCMRIEKPLQLAVRLMEKAPGWTEKKIQQEIRKGKNRAVQLPETVPVHVVYWTAWMDLSGALQIRDDAYGLDKLWNQDK